jgi:hypothetical protein
VKAKAAIGNCETTPLAADKNVFKKCLPSNSKKQAYASCPKNIH